MSMVVKGPAGALDHKYSVQDEVTGFRYTSPDGRTWWCGTVRRTEERRVGHRGELVNGKIHAVYRVRSKRTIRRLKLLLKKQRGRYLSFGQRKRMLRP